jgi:hypothetical protein
MIKSTKRGFWIIVTVAAVALLAGVFSAQITPAGAQTKSDHIIDVLVRFESEIFRTTPAGQYYEALAQKHGEELNSLMQNHPDHFVKIMLALESFVPGMEAMLDGKGNTVQITKEQVGGLKTELDWMASVGSDSLRADIEAEQQRLSLEHFVGMTMDEAWADINSKFPTVTEASRGPDLPFCVQGPDPDCLNAPMLVPNSDGQWAYYVWNGIYFEYPSIWRIEKLAGLPMSLFLLSTRDSPEFNSESDIEFRTVPLLNPLDAPTDPLTYPQTAWRRPAPIWNRLVSLPDFTGSESVWTDNRYPLPIYLDVTLYNPNTNMILTLHEMFMKDQKNNSLYDPELFQKRYPGFQHLVESIRIGEP